MPDYRRAQIAGGTFFFALVTYNRLLILTGEMARLILHSAWEEGIRALNGVE